MNVQVRIVVAIERLKVYLHVGCMFLLQPFVWVLFLACFLYTKHFDQIEDVSLSSFMHVEISDIVNLGCFGWKMAEDFRLILSVSPLVAFGTP